MRTCRAIFRRICRAGIHVQVQKPCQRIHLHRFGPARPQILLGGRTVASETYIPALYVLSMETFGKIRIVQLRRDGIRAQTHENNDAVLREKGILQACGKRISPIGRRTVHETRHPCLSRAAHKREERQADHQYIQQKMGGRSRKIGPLDRRCRT